MPLKTMPTHWLMLATLAFTAALYWTGLSGPFVFDDRSNFAVIQEWLSGEASLQKAVFGHQSLLYSRPLAMASFALNAAIGGDDGFYFKLGNLIVHLLCGWILWRISRLALAQDGRLADRSEVLAWVIAAFWLLHPLHVSTVLYAVQRMAQLSTLFTLAAVWTYLIARGQLATGQWRKPVLLLFLALPLWVLAGLLSKQNAAVATALCLAFELGYFLRQPRPRLVLPAFFGLFLFLPLLGIAGLLFARPDALLSGYADYEFTLPQRLLSESRALMDYLGQLLFPRSPLMGLYSDDFAVSTSLLTPLSTLLSVLALAGISLCAVLLRQRAPTFFVGWFFFLIAHTVESGFLPLDLYFEHRNYLPAAGLLMGLVGLTALVPRDLATNILTSRQLGLLAAGAFILVLSFATLGRVLVWKDKQSIVDQGVKHHPDSLRARLDQAGLAYDRGNNALHDAVMLELTRSSHPRHRMIGELYLVAIACERGTGGDPARLARAAAAARPQVTFTELHAFDMLARTSKGKGCGAVTDEMLAATITEIVAAAKAQPDSMQPKWLSRFAAAGLYSRAGKYDLALEQAKLAWQPNADPGVGGLLLELYAQRGDAGAVDRTFVEIGDRTKCHDKKNLEGLGKAWMQLEQYRLSRDPGQTPRTPPSFRCRSW